MGIAGSEVYVFFLCLCYFTVVLFGFLFGYCIAILYENSSPVSERKSVDVASAEISVTRKNDFLSKAENFLSAWIVDPAVYVFHGAMNFTENCKLSFLNKKEQGTFSPWAEEGSSYSHEKNEKVAQINNTGKQNYLLRSILIQKDKKDKKDKKTVRWKEHLCEYDEKSKSDFSYLVFSRTESLDHQYTQNSRGQRSQLS